MFKVMAFLHKRSDISRDELIEHYEQHHVPLILGLGPRPLHYRRNYVLPRDGASEVADVITELTFADRAAYESWVARMYAPGSGVSADEQTFLDRTRTTSVVVQEYPSR